MHKIGAVPKSELLSTRQAAERHGVSVWTIARRVRDGDLEPALRLEGRTGAMLFTADAVDACFGDES